MVLCEASERFEVAERICMERGSTMIPPYDDYDVMAGQGTLGLELMEQCPELSTVIVPASGGGLIGGVSAAVKSVSDHTKVYGRSRRPFRGIRRARRPGNRCWCP